MPGSDVNPIKLASKGVTPVALLSSPTFDATTVDAAAVRLGPAQTPSVGKVGTQEDVDGDGRLDLVLTFSTVALGLSMTSKQACLTGPLSDGESFLSCDTVRPQ